MDHYKLHFLLEKYKVWWMLNWVFCGVKLLVLNLSQGRKQAIFEQSAKTGFQVQLFSRNIQATLFFNCHIMKADANELWIIGHLLAQVELILHCDWKSDLATPTQMLALV